MKKTLLPIHILILFLTLLTLWSTVTWNGLDPQAWLLTLRNLVALSLMGFGVRLGIRTLIDPTYTTRPEHRMISTLILFLLFDALTPWWVFLILGAATELSQYFIRTPMGPLFNPAALGALLVSLFGFLPSWWGVNPAPRFSLLGVEISVLAWIMALGAGYVIYKYRKLTIIWSALASFALGYTVLFQVNPSYFLLEGTLIFFITVMVCEPKTSPVLKRDQILYGVLVGALVPLGLYAQFLEASLIALLLGNLYTGRHFIGKLFSSSEKATVPIA